uniref:Uncharacterized protein n=1 Tax=Geospiza parvula TaxID=87175 RepID=A0A8U8B8G5_GEOPR
VPMFCLSPGWPQCPCSQGVCATGMWCTGGCDTDRSSGFSKLFGDNPHAPSHKNCCPHWDTLGAATIPCTPHASVPTEPPPPNPLVLQVPAQALLEGDTVTLRCRCQQDNHLTWVGSLRRTKLSLSSLQLHHSGRYGCEGLVGSWQSRSAAVTVTAHELFPVPVLEDPPEAHPGVPPDSQLPQHPQPPLPRPPPAVFYRDGQVVGGPQGSPQLLVPAVGVSHSGNFRCEGTQPFLDPSLAPTLLSRVPHWVPQPLHGYPHPSLAPLPCPAIAAPSPSPGPPIPGSCFPPSLIVSPHPFPGSLHPSLRSLHIPQVTPSPHPLPVSPYPPWCCPPPSPGVPSLTPPSSLGAPF